MTRRYSSRHAAWILAMLVWVSGNVGWVEAPANVSDSRPTGPTGADPPPMATVPTAAPSPTSAPTVKTGPPKAKRFHARLPAHYASVVDDNQRQAIYAIQEQYSGRIAVIQAQLEALTKERDDKIAALLTAQQLEKIGKLKAAGKDNKREQPREKK